MNRAKRSFSNKYALFMGDSSFQETVEELLLLLEGKASYIGQIQGRDQHRNQIIRSEEINSTIRFRWFGHKTIEGNFGGVVSMLETAMEPELHCLLGMHPNCPKPDIIVIQSSHHDLEYEEFYGGKLPTLMHILRHTQAAGSKTYWKGSGTFAGRSPAIDALNEYAATVAKDNGIPFINMTQEFRRIESFMNVSLYFTTYPHVGMNGHSSEMVFSNLLTQYFLRELFHRRYRRKKFSVPGQLSVT